MKEKKNVIYIFVPNLSPIMLCNIAACMNEMRDAPPSSWRSVVAAVKEVIVVYMYGSEDNEGGRDEGYSVSYSRDGRRKGDNFTLGAPQ